MNEHFPVLPDNICSAKVAKKASQRVTLISDVTVVPDPMQRHE